jgi:hypothetical protein
MPPVSQRLASTRATIGYTEDDERRVHATRPSLLPHADAIAEAVYAHLLSVPETAVYFTLPDGRPDRAHLARREDSLKGWLSRTLEAPLDEDFALYLVGIGRAHTRGGGDPAVFVRARHLVSTMAFVQAALVGLLDAAFEDRSELLAAIASWNKLLLVQLDLFLSAYGDDEDAGWY